MCRFRLYTIQAGFFYTIQATSAYIIQAGGVFDKNATCVFIKSAKSTNLVGRCFPLLSALQRLFEPIVQDGDFLFLEVYLYFVRRIPA